MAFPLPQSSDQAALTTLSGEVGERHNRWSVAALSGVAYCGRVQPHKLGPLRALEKSINILRMLAAACALVALPAIAQTVTDGDTIKQGGVTYRL